MLRRLVPPNHDRKPVLNNEVYGIDAYAALVLGLQLVSYVPVRDAIAVQLQDILLLLRLNVVLAVGQVGTPTPVVVERMRIVPLCYGR